MSVLDTCKVEEASGKSEIHVGGLENIDTERRGGQPSEHLMPIVDEDADTSSEMTDETRNWSRRTVVAQRLVLLNLHIPFFPYANLTIFSFGRMVTLPSSGR